MLTKNLTLICRTWLVDAQRPRKLRDMQYLDWQTMVIMNIDSLAEPCLDIQYTTTVYWYQLLTGSLGEVGRGAFHILPLSMGLKVTAFWAILVWSRVWSDTIALIIKNGRGLQRNWNLSYQTGSRHHHSSCNSQMASLTLSSLGEQRLTLKTVTLAWKYLSCFFSANLRIRAFIGKQPVSSASI